MKQRHKRSLGVLAILVAGAIVWVGLGLTIGWEGLAVGVYLRFALDQWKQRHDG